MPRKKSQIDPALVLRIIQNLSASDEEIASSLGVGRTTVCKWRKDGIIGERNFELLQELSSEGVVNLKKVRLESLIKELNRQGFKVLQK